MDIQTIKQRFGIIGSSPLIERALDIALRVAPTDLSVLITGESGVGKEFFPKIIHSFSTRKHGNYIAVNCGAIPEGTIDSELFGHEKGSFTGASESRKGYFEMADGGTIFLDEVAELPLTTQVRLLRVLQTGEFIKVGSSKVQKTSVRVVAATNLNLAEAIANGKFREDLFYRLNTVPIIVPPLRGRKEDIYILFRKFASDVALQYRMPQISLDPSAREVLENYYWPGNIRQLKNVAEQMSVIEEKREISTQSLERYLAQAKSSTELVTVGREQERFTDFSGHQSEFLYKVLYDMKSQLAELQSKVDDMHAIIARDGVSIKDVKHSDMPSHAAAYLPAATYSGDNEIYDTAEEVIELPEEVMTKEKSQRDAIVKALKQNAGRRRNAARQLFISERTLYRKMKELGITEEDIA